MAISLRLLLDREIRGAALDLIRKLACLLLKNHDVILNRAQIDAVDLWKRRNIA